MAGKRVVVFGADGMLGTDLCEVARRRTDWDLFPSTIFDRDITDAAAVREFIAEVGPDVIVNCAAYTQVDQAESDEETAMAINAAAVGCIAGAAAQAGARLVHFSTDYVFDGTKGTPYEEDDEPNPLGVYGRSKLAGERAIERTGADSLIIRTSWLYGRNGSHFVSTVLRLARERDEITMVDDQVGAPTWTADLAGVIPDLVEKEVGGILNVVNSGACSWYQFARKIVEISGSKLRLKPIRSEELDRPAPRPKNSRLSLRRFIAIMGAAPRGWDEALWAYLGSG